MKGTVHYETRGAIALMTIDNPPVNPLSSGVRQGLHDGITKALADDSIAAIVLTGAGRAFIAGADISEFGSAASEGAGLHECLSLMENSPKPIIAGLNGTAFGHPWPRAPPFTKHYVLDKCPRHPVARPAVCFQHATGTAGTCTGRRDNVNIISARQ